MTGAQAGAIDVRALGWALSAALVVVYVVCALAAIIWPEAPLAHNWLALFSVAPRGSLRSFVEGVVGSLAFAWITAVVIGFVYNRLAARG